MAKPHAMATIDSTIQPNISAMNNMEQELASLDARVVNLNSQLMIPQVRIERKELPNLRTVCMADECTEPCLDADGKLLVRYKTHCHPHCHCLDNVTLEAYPDPALQKCEAMIHQEGQVVCKVCGCPWSMHMHIDYEQYEVTMVEHPEVRKQLQSTNKKRKLLEKLVAKTQERIQRYTEEEGRINATAAMFASFLQLNAILPYNDAVREYLQCLISEDNGIADKSQDPEDLDKLAALENFLAEYKKQRNFFERHLKTGATTIEPRDIKRFIEELKNLPLTGEEIRKLYEQEEKGQSQQD